MRKIVSIVTMLFFVGVVYSQKNIKDLNGWMEDDLNGSVKSVVSAVYNLTDSFGEIKKGDLLERREIKFDQGGNYLEFNGFDSDRNNKTLKVNYDWENYQVTCTTIDNQLREIDEIELLKFNDDWNLIESTSYDGEGKVQSKQIYKFNHLGKVREEIHVSENKFSLRQTFNYDNKGNLLSERYSLDDGDGYIKSYAYDIKGNLLIDEYLGGDINYSTHYAYDKDDNKVEECSNHSEYGEKYKCTFFKYNEVGNVVSKTYSVRGEPSEKYTLFNYDNNGTLMGEYTIEAKDTIKTILYNNKGQMTEKVWFTLDKNFSGPIEDIRFDVKNKITKKYSEKGDLVFWETEGPQLFNDFTYSYSFPSVNFSFDNDDDVFYSIREFDYDEFSNCIQEIVYINFMPKYIVEREFEYFE